MTRTDLESIKGERSVLKRKVTTIKNRLHKSAQVQDPSPTIMEATFIDLNNTFLDFSTVDEEYAAALDEAEELRAEYEVVNGLGLEGYTLSVESIYNDGKLIYDQFKQKLFKKEVLSQIKEAQRKLDTVIPRVDRLLSDKGDILELELDRDELKEVAELVKGVREQIGEPAGGLEDTHDDTEDLLTTIEEKIRAINLELRRRSRDDGSRDSSLRESFHEQSDKDASSDDMQAATTGVSTTSSVDSPTTASNPQVFPPSLAGMPYQLPSTGICSTGSMLSPSARTTAGPPASVPGMLSSTGFPNTSGLSYPYGSSYPIPSLPLSSYPVSTAMYSTVGVPVSSMMSPGVSSAMSSGVGGLFPPISSQQAAVGPTPTTPLGPSAAAPWFNQRPNIPEVKVKRVELPQFNGSRQAWPEFKVLWPKLAVPTFRADQETLASELRRCLSGTAAEMVRSISVIGQHPYNHMWQRLCEYYDDSAATVRAAIRRLKSLRPVQEDDHRGLTYLINEVEAAYSMLTTLNQVNCLTLIQVDELAVLLPPLMRKDWNKLYYKLLGDQRNHPFPSLMAFLIEERNVISRLVEDQEVPKKKKESSHHTGGGKKPTGQKSTWQKNGEGTPSKSQCAVHPHGSVQHKTAQCAVFVDLGLKEKLDALRSVGACFRCFGYHRRANCKVKDPCARCGDNRHPTLLCRRENLPSPSAPSELEVASSGSHSAHSKSLSLYAIFSVPVDRVKRQAVVFTDDGSDSSYITNRAAKLLGARKLRKYLLEVTTTGGKETEYESQEYELDLVTRAGRKVTVTMFGLEKITGRLSKLDLSVIAGLFPQVEASRLQRTSTEVDILLGTDFFGLHPKNEVQSAGENLSVMEGALGLCLQGSHADLKEEVCMDANFVRTLKSATAISVNRNSNHSISVIHPIINSPRGLGPVRCIAKTHLTLAEKSTVLNFIQGEELATQIVPKCGSCRCSKCPLPGHTYSFEEEAELKLIRDNLRYDESAEAWVAKYPWKIDPHSLPDNRGAVLSSLYRLKKKLRKDEQLSRCYQEQMADMVVRGVAREVSAQELAAYKGPSFYINHLGVPNPRSKSTPFRIVFDSSQTYKGASLNNYLCKGPDAYLNNQLGLLLRWREQAVAILGDIRKFYNSIFLEEGEQHCHRFLWSEPENPVPRTYVMTRVNMGDKPAGAISTEALYMTADKFFEDHPRAATMLREGSYVDDLMDSVKDREEAEDLTGGAERMLSKGGFKVKFWLFSGDAAEEEQGITEILGVSWNPKEDQIVGQASLNFSPKKRGVYTLPDLNPDEIPRLIPEVLTRRMVLAQVMRIYDPFGMWSPVILIGKVLLRETWECQLGWDDAVPADLHGRWVRFFIASKELNGLRYPRVLKPAEAVGDPMLVIFSDASDAAYGFVAYVRWQLRNNTFSSRLILAKCRIAPLNKRSTPQLELNAAVLAKRGREVIIEEMRYKFTSFLHIVDSETVLCMLQKTSTRFNIYEGVRVGEIQASTQGDVSSWAWIAGNRNIADWITRGKNPEEIGAVSDWFSGPSYMSTPMEEWGLKFGQPSEGQLLPGEKKIVSSHSAGVVGGLLQYHQFSSYPRMLRVAARVLNVFIKKSLGAVIGGLTPGLLKKSEEIIIKDVQRSINDDCLRRDKRGRVGGKFYRLNPTMVDGLWVVGGRLVFNPMALDNHPQRLLPTNHPVTALLMKQAHVDTVHGSRDTTLARFRNQFWTPQGSKVASSVVNSCQECRLRKPRLMSQRMGQLPEVRSKPSPPFTSVMIDYFGPYAVRGDVQKRISGKAWGIIFTDLVSRAVFIEGVFEYTTDAFLLALSKFASCRGYPEVIYSDPGSNLVGASRELADQWGRMWQEDGDRISTHSAERGLRWVFSTADSPWQNGAVEALVKSCKKAISFSMNDRRLSPFEFSCMLYSVANLINERPIGTLPGVDSELNIITPNSLLLGRSTARNPGGWEPVTTVLKRFHLIQEVAQAFWKQWTKTVAPGLITSAKWQVKERNLQVGDVVLISHEGAIKGEYRLGVVKAVFPDTAGVVRKVAVMYKHHSMKDKRLLSREQVVTRPVQRLSLVAPIAEETPGLA